MPKQQQHGLGRGLDALIRPAAAAVPDDATLDTGLSNAAIFEVPIAAIAPNPTQPRLPMSEDPQLLELAHSIREHGLLQPILLALAAEDELGPRYYIIAGERRWRAAQIAGLVEVPAVIREATPLLMLELALVENLQRTDLSPLEEARGYQMLVEEHHLTHEQIASAVGRNRVTITNTLRLLQLPDEVKEALITMPKVFTEGHARAVLQINGDAERILATKQIIAQMMSVRQAEELARRYNEAALKLTPDRRGGRVRQQSYETRALEEEFTRAVEMKARLQRSTKGRGSLTLYFTNDEQLQHLYERIVGQEIAALAQHDGLGRDVFGYGNGGDSSARIADAFMPLDADDDRAGEN